jgi:hypothetical protein
LPYNMAVTIVLNWLFSCLISVSWRIVLRFSVVAFSFTINLTRKWHDLQSKLWKDCHVTWQ